MNAKVEIKSVMHICACHFNYFFFTIQNDNKWEQKYIYDDIRKKVNSEIHKDNSMEANEKRIIFRQINVGVKSNYLEKSCILSTNDAFYSVNCILYLANRIVIAWLYVNKLLYSL